MSCALLGWKTWTTARNTGYKNYSASNSFQTPASTAAASQGVLTKLPGHPHVSNKQNQSRMHWRNGLALPDWNLWLCLAGMLLLLLPLHLQQSSEQWAGSGQQRDGSVPTAALGHQDWTTASNQTWDCWHKTDATLPPFHPPNIFCELGELNLLSMAESSTTSAKEMGQHCATGNGHCRQDHLLGCWGNEASVTVHKVPSLRSAEESLHKTHYDNVPLFPTASKRTLSFCSALAAVRPH